MSNEVKSQRELKWDLAKSYSLVAGYFAYILKTEAETFGSHTWSTSGPMASSTAFILKSMFLFSILSLMSSCTDSSRLDWLACGSPFSSSSMVPSNVAIFFKLACKIHEGAASRTRTLVNAVRSIVNIICARGRNFPQGQR